MAAAAGRTAQAPHEKGRSATDEIGRRPVSPGAGGDLKDKVVLVTGAGRGIGRACALSFAQVGADVVLAARTPSELESVAAEVAALGRRALAVPCDVSVYDDCAMLSAAALQALGRVDVLINNAGATLQGKVTECDPGAWASVVHLNVVGVFNVCHVVVPIMKKQGGGQIVMMGSGAGHAPAVGLSAYGASKAGLSYFAKVLSQEVWRHGIDVNEVVPGPVVTRLTQEHLAAGGGGLRSLPSERVKTPQEVGDFVRWLVQRPPGGPTGQVFSLARRPL